MVATSPPQTPYIPWYRRWDLPALVPGVLLALIMVWSVVQSIANAGWANGLQVLVSVALPAVLIGAVFARLHWLPAWLAHLLSAALGVAWAVQRVGPLLVNEIAAESGQAQAAWLVNWTDRATEILIRGISLVRILQAGGRGEDIVLFIVALALLMWALGYTTSWLLFRAGWTWWAVVLNALTILVNYTFASPKPNVLFFVFLGTALLLIAQQYVVRQQENWEASSMEYPEFISWRFLAAAALFCGALVLVTSMLPSEVSSAQIARAWRVMSAPLTAAREGWEVAFSTINAPPGTGGGGFTTRAVRVGGGRVLGDAVVMRVQSSQYDYWRAVAFDRYTGHGWLSMVGERARAATGRGTVEQARTALEADATLQYADARGRTLVTQTVELVQDRTDDLIVVGGQLARPGLPVLVQSGFVGTGNQAQPNYDETTAIYAQLPLQATQAYTVVALVSTVDEQSLRNAGTNYPAWVSEQYLDLPESVTQRTRDQARAIVEQAGATNPYDRALAVQNYLRRFVYDETRPAPPDNRDWVDYFLFDGQRGYCDDFATAMVVMLRSLDIPARWVQGYAGGAIDPDTGAYVVRESIAHSWPEVYFPGFGWQRFEPTPASYASVPTRPAQPGPGDEDQLGPTRLISPAVGLGDVPLLDEDMPGRAEDLEALRRAAEASRQAARQRQLMIAGSIAAVLAVAAGVFFLALRREERGLSQAAVTYLRLTRLAGWAGWPQKPHVTPHEYATELGRNLPAHRQTIDRVAHAYVTERFSPRAAHGEPISKEEWQALRRPLLMRLFTRFTTAPRQKPKGKPPRRF